MPKVVEVPNVGNVEFPDTMGDDEISQVIRKQVGGTSPAPAPRGPTLRDLKTPGLLSGEYSKPMDVGDETIQSTVAPGESLPHAVTRQAIGGGRTALSGLYNTVRHPIDTLESIPKASYEQGRKAVKLAKEGRYSEAVGHGTAAVLPGVGPMFADATEKAVTGTVGPAAELATYAAVPKVAKETAKAIPGAVEGTGNLARMAAERNVEQVLGATTKKLKAISSEKVVPGILDRKITANTRQGLSDAAAEGVKKHGAQVDASIANHTASGVLLQTQPLIDDLESIKGQYTLKSKASGAVTARRSAPIEKIEEAQETIRKYGPTIRPDDLVEVRRFLDESVAKKKMAFLSDDTKTFEGEAEEAASHSLRGRINEEFPDLADSNEEFSFYKNLQTVVDATLQRKASQSGLMGKALKMGMGGYGGSLLGGPSGAVIGAGAEFLHDTPAYRTRAALAEKYVADKIGTPQKPGFQRPPRKSIKVWPGGNPNPGNTGGPQGPNGSPSPSTVVTGHTILDPSGSPFARQPAARLNAAPKQLTAGEASPEAAPDTPDIRGFIADRRSDFPRVKQIAAPEQPTEPSTTEPSGKRPFISRADRAALKAKGFSDTKIDSLSRSEIEDALQ